MYFFERLNYAVIIGLNIVQLQVGKSRRLRKILLSIIATINGFLDDAIV